MTALFDEEQLRVSYDESIRKETAEKERVKNIKISNSLAISKSVIASKYKISLEEVDRYLSM